MNEFNKAQRARILSCYGETPESLLQKSLENELEKGGKRALIGEKRTFGGREYIKTHDGWKFHGKGTGEKAKEHMKNSVENQEELSGESQHVIDHFKKNKVQALTFKNDDKLEAKLKGIESAIKQGYLRTTNLVGDGVRVSATLKLSSTYFDDNLKEDFSTFVEKFDKLQLENNYRSRSESEDMIYQSKNIENLKSLLELKSVKSNKELSQDIYSRINYIQRHPELQESEPLEQKEFKYNLLYRPFGIGTYPKEGFARYEEDGTKYGQLIFNRPLSVEEIKQYELKSNQPEIEKMDTGSTPGFETVTENGKLVKGEDNEITKAD